MAAETIQAPAAAMPAVAKRGATTGGGARGGSSNVRAGAGLLPPPRRGQIKEKILKEFVAAVTAGAMAAGLVKNNRAGDGGEEGLPASDDDN